jgi:hypothetical protein
VRACATQGAPMHVGAASVTVKAPERKAAPGDA